ncbi:Scr1 family TA system antitoxin-like transcriptional regulator, partial [Actinophytocola sp.]|uniref:Scr1 family TA system antitoxin-like transcriptional regulator n=1 Tax=Actinophytocola sp. TaxID=1872138 RepID=UPI003D6B9523
VLRRRAPAHTPGTLGRPRRHGGEFVFGDPATWGEPDVSTHTDILGTVDYSAYISETALRTPFGGPEGHRKQLKHLLGAGDRGIAVRIVREHLPVGLISHSWLYMTFPNTTPVVNVEVAEGGVYLHDDQAEPYTNVVTKLDHIALPTRESQAMLRSMLKEV